LNPNWSPDGTQIVFTSTRNPGDNEIYVMNADGSNQIRLSNNPASDDQADWSWTGSVPLPTPTVTPTLTPVADAGQIVFISNRDGNNEIYKMDPNGSNQTRLTNNTAPDDQPAWSPNRTKIVFHSTRDNAN